MENHIFSADTHSQNEGFADGFDSFAEDTGNDDVFFNSRGKRLRRKAARKTRKAARKMRRATRAEMKGKHKKAARLRGKAQKKLDKASNKLDRLKSQDQLLEEQQALQDKAQSGGGSGGGGGDDSGGGGESPAQVEQQPLQDQGGGEAPQEQYQPQQQPQYQAPQQSGGGSGGSGGGGIDNSTEEEEPQEGQTIDELIGEQEEQREQEIEEQNADDFETAVGLHTGRHGKHHKKGLHKKHKLPVKELLADDFQSAIGLHVGRIEHKKTSLAMLVYHSKNEQQGRAYIAGQVKIIAKIEATKKALQHKIDLLKKSIAAGEKVFAAKYKKSYSNAEGDHFSAGEKVIAKSFFEKNKKALLIGAGVVAGAFLFLKFGKKLMK